MAATQVMVVLLLLLSGGGVVREADGTGRDGPAVLRQRHARARSRTRGEEDGWSWSVAGVAVVMVATRNNRRDKRRRSANKTGSVVDTWAFVSNGPGIWPREPSLVVGSQSQLALRMPTSAPTSLSLLYLSCSNRHSGRHACIDEQTGRPARPGPGSIVPGQVWPVVPPCRAAPGFVLGRRPRPGPWAYFRAGPAQMARPKWRAGPAPITHKHMKISIFTNV